MAMRSVARRFPTLTTEKAELKTPIAELVTAVAPYLLASRDQSRHRRANIYRLVPPDDANVDWYTDRALWRWKPNQNLNNGGKQFLCPQCTGTVDTTAKTRKPRAINSDGPFLSIEDEYCCLGLASISLALLDSFQRIPYGTLAWKQSYGRRNIIEKSNSMLKDKGGLNAGWCRAFGLAAHTIGALALAVAHNLKELKRILSRQKRNGATPEPSHNGTHTASTTEESLSPTLSTRGPP